MTNIQLSNLEKILRDSNVDYSLYKNNFIIETASDGAMHYGIALNETAPTLILKAKKQYYAAILCGNTRISFKKLKKSLGENDISMADPQTVFNITGAKIGEVCLINTHLITLVDKNILNNKNCYGGCGVPKTTLRINTLDLIRITNAQLLDFTEPRS